MLTIFHLYLCIFPSLNLNLNFKILLFYRWVKLSLTTRKEHRLRVLENKALRKVFGPNRQELTGRRINLQNEELHNLYASSYIFR